MSTDRLQVSVVLPCLNEVESVGIVVREALAAITASGYSGEVVICDNGSVDGSPEAASAAGARVVHESMRGYGAALRTGIDVAHGTVVVMADADNTYPFEFLRELVDPVLAGTSDMTIGARWTGATSETMPFLHRFVGTPVLTWLVRRAGGPGGLTDSQSGFRAFRRDALLTLGLRSTGMEYASEMIIVAGRAGWRINEIKAGYRERIGDSKLDTVGDGWRHLKTIVQLAPDLLATYPGIALMVVGGLLLGGSFLDHAVTVIGSLGWLCALVGPVLLVLGAQGLLFGTVIAAASPLGGRRGREPLANPERLRNAAVGGGWLMGVGIVLDLTLLISWVWRLGAPLVGLPMAGLAQAMLLVGATLVAYGGIGAVVLAGSRRWTAPRTDGAPASDLVGPSVQSEAEQSAPYATATP